MLTIVLTISVDDLQSLSQDASHLDLWVPSQKSVDTHSTACFDLGSAKLISAATRFVARSKPAGHDMTTIDARTADQVLA